MYYFVLVNDVVRKYYVNYDQEKILALRESLVNKYRSIVLSEINNDNCPYFIRLVDRFIHGDDSSIDEILGFVGVEDLGKIYYHGCNIPLDENINLMVDNIKNISLDKQINNCQNLIELLQKKKRLLETLNIKHYYVEFQELLSFELIDEIKLEYFQEMLTFLNIEYKPNKGNSYNNKIKSLII